MNNSELIITKYVEQTSILINLPIPLEYQAGVIKNFQSIQTIAELVNQFSLPEEIESAAIFQP